MESRVIKNRIDNLPALNSILEEKDQNLSLKKGNIEKSLKT